jgi:hypothetical protein
MRHQNIVELYDYTETNDEYLLFMEFCDKADHLSKKIAEVRYNILLILDISRTPQFQTFPSFNLMLLISLRD